MNPDVPHWRRRANLERRALWGSALGLKNDDALDTERLSLSSPCTNRRKETSEMGSNKMSFGAYGQFL